MMITKKAIKGDIDFIITTLKNRDVTIPSFLSCAAPGLAFMLGMTLWQFFIAYDTSTFKPTIRMDSLPSVCFSLFLGFMIFIALTGMRGKYLSLPSEIRRESLIVRLIKQKTLFYVGVWIVVNLIGGLWIKTSGLSPMISCAVQLVPLVFIWLIAAVDFGRYDLAVLGSVIKAWRDGDKLDPEQLKELDI